MNIRFVWFTVKLFPARSNAVMLKSTWPSAWPSCISTVTLAFAIMPLVLIVYVNLGV